MDTRPILDFDIKSPTTKSPSASEDGICGTSWGSAVEIRAPYRGVDQYVSVLPIMQEMIPFPTKSSDLEAAVPNLGNKKFWDNILEGIDGASEILDQYDSAGYMDDKNRSAISRMIARSVKYYDHALALIKHWGNQTQFSPAGWPLAIMVPDYCDDLGVGKGGCPTANDIADHESDQLLVFRLLLASIRNARCAQEAAASVGTYFRNKEAYKSQMGSGLGLKYSPKRAAPKLVAAQLGGASPEPDPGPPPVPGLDEGPEDEGDGVDVGETTAPKKKKKDNTILIAGAAALGLLLLKK